MKADRSSTNSTASISPTGQHHLLTDGKSRNAPGPYSNRGDRMAFTSTKRNGRDNDVYVMDPESPDGVRMVYQARGAWRPADWSPDDKRLLLVNYLSINESYVHILDLESGKTEPVQPAGKVTISYGGAQWSPDGHRVYFTSDEESEFHRLRYLDLATRKVTALTGAIDWDVENFRLSPDGKVLAFTANEDGISTLRLLDTVTGKELPRPKLPVGQVTLGDFHPKRAELSLAMVSAKVAMDVYSYEWESGKLTRWTYSEVGGLNAESFPESKLIHYATFDKVNGKPRMIPAFIVKPQARFKAPYPVLISIHGGPESQSRPGLNSSYYVNEMGIAVIQPNVRGSTGYGKAYVKLDNAEKREDSVKDIGALLDWIATQPDLDAKRVAVTGGSYGGYMTLASLVHYSDRLRCGIDVVGISNWVTFLRNTQSYRQDLRRAEYGDERDPKMRDLFETISPLSRAERIKVPLMVVQGKNDPRVPVTESEQMVKKIRENAGNVWYVMAKDEGHGFQKKGNRDYQNWVTILFLEKYLLGRE